MNYDIYNSPFNHVSFATVKHEGSSVLGIRLRFTANVTDIISIPMLSWTSMLIGHLAGARSPSFWRLATLRDGLHVSLDSAQSDANSTKNEVLELWWKMQSDLTKARTGFNRVGLHQQHLDRVTEPLNVRVVEIRTLHSDYLAYMRACGSSEIVKISTVLFDCAVKAAFEEKSAGSSEDFLWANASKAESEEPFRSRYEQAMSEGYDLAPQFMPWAPPNNTPNYELRGELNLLESEL